MSQAPDIDLRPLSEAEVAEYLFRHPDFLARHPELLAVLAMPERDIAGAEPQSGEAGGGEVVDLHQAMLARLRAELSRSQQREGELIASSRSNLHTASRIHAAVLALLGARTFEHLIDTVTTDLGVLLDVDVVSLCVEGGEVPQIGRGTAYDGVRVVPDGLVTEFLGAGNDVVLRGNVVGDKRVFGSGAGLVRSEALIRLRIRPQPPQALVAFGSREPDYFDPSQATELIAFLGQVLEHGLREWLDLPD